MIRTDKQILQGCIKRASYAVNMSNNPVTRMVLDALIEKQIRDEKVERLQAQLEAARESLANTIGIITDILDSGKVAFNSESDWAMLDEAKETQAALEAMEGENSES